MSDPQESTAGEHAPLSFRVLLADDDKDSRERVRSALHAHFEAVAIEEIPDHVAFFRSLQGIDFDLVITAQDLHWSTGAEVLSAVKSLRPTIPVIMISPADDSQVAEHALRSGLHAYLVDSDDLASSLRSAVRSALQIAVYEEKVVSLEERLHDILDSLAIGVFRSTLDGRLLDANAAYVRLLGFASLDEARKGDLGKCYVEPDARRKLLEQLTEHGQVRDYQVELRRTDGATIWVSLTETCSPTPAGELEIDGIAEDVTSQREAQAALEEGHRALAEANEALQRANEQYRAIFETVSAATVIIDEDLTVSMVNSAFEELSGYSRSEVEGHKAWPEFIARDDIEGVRELHRRHLAGDDKAPRDAELLFLNRDAEVLQVQASVAVLPGTRRCVTSLLNLTARRQMEEQLLHNAFHDALTDLPNRFHLQDRLEDILADGLDCALLLFDLDRFKIINDSLGHRVGDELLQTVNLRLRSELQEVDTLARVDGNTFGAILSPLSHVGEAPALASRLQRCLAEPFEVAGHSIYSSASTGIALSAHATCSDDLLRNAEAAMNRAKSQGRNRWVVFEPSMHEMAKLVFTLENDLRHALVGDQFRLHYQPIVNLETRDIIGYDALLRWQHPSSGLMLPDAFLQVAEDSGLMVPIGRWVLAEACRQLKRRQRDNQRNGSVFVNVKLTPGQFGHPELAGEIREILDTTGLSPRSLMLGLREGVLADNPVRAGHIVAGLRELDVQLCLDDFGVGYSSLPHLNRTSFNTVKIDRTFLADIAADDERWRIIDVLHRIGSHLGVRVVAKGIETEVQLARLLQLGYRYGQGHLFARPEPSPPSAPKKVRFRVRGKE